jgi:hypothetical protein
MAHLDTPPHSSNHADNPLDYFTTDTAPTPITWKATARALERKWGIRNGSITFVQLTSTVASRGWKIIEDYRPFFNITDDEFSAVVRYMRAWEVLRSCCGPQMSADYRARLYGNGPMDYTPHRSSGSLAYDNCESYDVDTIEKELIGLRLYKECDHLRDLQKGISWASLNGTFCAEYKKAAIRTKVQFNGNPWEKGAFEKMK